MKRLLWFFALILFLPTLLEAKVPELRIASKNKSYALPLVDLAIEITIRQHLAKTEFILTYKNDKDRDLRGEFLFPLPDEAVVTDIGLYFGDQLRHSVVVEREQGRQVFEEVVHRRVDPALAEWRSGNVFRLDVYPIPAHGEKKVYVAYQEVLSQQNGSWSASLDLQYKLRFRKFNLEIHADPDSIVQAPFTFNRNGNDWSSEQQNVMLDSKISISSSIPAPMAAIAEPADEEGLYYVSLPIKPNLQLNPIEKTDEVILLWDSSGSASHQNREKFFGFLQAFCAKQNGNVNVKVFPFHYRVEESFSIPNASTSVGFEQLKRRLQNVHSIGATNLTEVIQKLPEIAGSSSSSSRIILVTDGFDTLHPVRITNDSMKRLSEFKKPLLILSSPDHNNSDFLNGLAAATHGWFINLENPSRAFEQEVKRTMMTSVTASVFSSSSNFTETFPQSFHIVENSVYHVTALTHNPNGRGSLTLQFTGEVSNEYQEVSFDYRILNDSRGLIRTQWAGSKLDQLMITPGNHDQELLDLGKRFHLITPITSLIVLETWQDYQRYGIPMPPDLQQQYEKQFQTVKGNQISRAGNSSIFGRVLDDRGLPLPGVSLVLMSSNQQQSIVTSGPTGAFLFSNLPPGSYSVSASIEGFTEIRQEDIRVNQGNGVQLDLILKPTLTEEFVVVADTPVVDTRKTGNSTTFNSEYMDGVPSGRSPSRHSNKQESNDSWNYDSVQNDRVIGKYKSLEDLLKAIANASNVEEKCKLYLEGRSEFEKISQLFFRASKLFEEQDADMSKRVLEDALEFGDPEAGTTRAVAHLLSLKGEFEPAKDLMEKTDELMPHQPQTWRELALLNARMGKREEAELWYQKIMTGQGDSRQGAIVSVATEEFNRLVNAAATNKGIDLELDPATDLKVVLTWDSNYTDVDLHVVEPSGEEVSYEHTSSKAGAAISDDNRSGFGPEVYTLRKALPGKYEVSVSYYSADRTSEDQTTTALVSVYQRNSNGTIGRTDYSVILSSDKERQKVVTIRVL